MISILILPKKKKYLSKLKICYGSIGAICALTSFISNNWIIWKYRDYYYYNYNMVVANMCNISFCHLPMLVKSAYIGIAFPIILLDLYLYGDDKHNYKALRHCIPWMTYDGKIKNENNFKTYINVNGTISKYGIISFYYRKNICFDVNLIRKMDY